MKTIWKFKLESTVEMPEYSKILFVDTQHNEPYIWVMVNPHRGMVKRYFRTYGTGHYIDDEERLGEYVGSFMLDNGALVSHVFVQTEEL